VTATTSDKVIPTHTSKTECNRELVLDNIVAVMCKLSLATQFCPGHNYDIILPTLATERKFVLDNIAAELSNLTVGGDHLSQGRSLAHA